AAEGKNYFVPVVEVKGKSGQVYLVNLTNLFHTDASLLHVPTSYIPKAGPLEIADAFSDSPKQEIAMVRSQFKAALNFLARENPGLSYRAKCGEDEFSLSFDSRESLENVGVCTEGNNPSVDLKELETLPEIIFLLEK
ncbi:MAG: hypothetical protein ACXWQO_13225, partial [Bdellovibrionota bacterium]